MKKILVYKKKILCGIGIVLFFLLEFCLAYAEKKYIFLDFGKERFIFLSIVNLFLCMHFIIPISKMYNYFYEKRYVLAFGFLAIFTLLQYHGSSIAAWDFTIQRNYHIGSGSVMLGKISIIRGDEYYVSTPNLFSQQFNNYNPVSNILMGRTGNVTMFPTLPSKDISILGNICNIPYLFLPIGYAFSCSWWLKVLLIFFGSFELCMIVSEKNKLNSLAGAMLITLSGASCWWSNMLILGIGSLAIVVIHEFFKESKTIKRVLLSILLGILGANYLAMMYPAWMVPFGYVYLGFVIWIILENREKLNYKLLLYIPIVLAVMFGIFLPAFFNSYSIYLQTSSTVYPGARLSLGGEGIDKLFSYYINLFFPFKEFYNSSEYGNFMSFFPLMIIYAVIILIKNVVKKVKTDWFLLIFSIISILLCVWNFIPLPKWLAKMSLLSFSTPARCQLAVGYASILILIRILSKHSKNSLSKNRIIVSIICSVIFNAFVFNFVYDYFSDYVTLKMFLALAIITLPTVALILINYKKTNKILAIILIFISLITGLTVNPLSKGVGVLNSKPVALEIRKIVSSDKKGRWIGVSTNYAIPNYLVANGASTINSTNYYPNLSLWHKIDKNKLNEDIYNRYAHIQIELTNDETSFELLLHDYILIHLNINDLKKIDVQYILSTYKIENFDDDLECIYDDAGAFIYKVKNREEN